MVSTTESKLHNKTRLVKIKLQENWQKDSFFKENKKGKKTY